MALALSALGCAEEAAIGDVNALQGSPDGRPASSGAGTLGPSPAWVAQANQAPGYVALAYPPPPYGNTTGTVAANMRFAGWLDPLAAAYDPTQSSVVEFAQFYDPDNTKDVEFLLVSAVAVWCGVCQQEYADLDSAQVYKKMRPRGVQMLGILFEDNDGQPAAYSDLKNWASAFRVGFPFVLDPSFNSGVYFDRSATPMNMLIDAKTMKIVWVITGYDPDAYDQLDRLLTQRGR